MSERQVKRVRILERRSSDLEARIGMLEAGMAVRADLDHEEARRAVVSARLREREARRREFVWRNLALGALLAALIVCVAAALAVGASGADAPDLEAQETGPEVRVIPEVELRPAAGYASLEALMEDGE